MAKKLYDEASVQAIANAIRAKNGEASTYKVAEMAAAIADISGSPIVDENLENTVQYRQMNATAAKFLAEVDYTESANDYSFTEVTNYYSETTPYSKEEPNGLQIKVPANTAITVEQGDKVKSEAVSGIGTIYNMEPLKAGTFAFGGKTYKIVPEGGVRMIYTPSVWNVRDLGGWACTGGRVKYGKIFRGGHFGSITDADKSTLVNWLGIATDIDLRNNSETGSISTSPLGSSVEYFHQSLDFYANAVSTSAASARTVAVLKKVMSCVAENKPCYFHCMSGADRTGTIAYLLLSLLGVSQSDKDKEYELTAFSDEADGKRFRNTNYNVTNGNGWYPLIKYFRDTYTGENDNEKVVAWAVANGIAASEINAFRAAMISGDAGEVVVPPQEYTVTNTLTGCTSSNAATTVTEGDTYYATITASSDYVLNGATVVVKMGGTDVTALYYADGVINIPDVSGNIEITITAKEAELVYTETSRGLNYGVKISSSDHKTETTGQTNYAATDYISAAGYTQYKLENSSIISSSNSNVGNEYLNFYDADKNYISCSPTAENKAGAAQDTIEGNLPSECAYYRVRAYCGSGNRNTYFDATVVRLGKYE